MLLKLDALRLSNLSSTEKPEKLNVPIDCIYVTKDGEVIATDGHIVLKMRGNVEEPGLFDAEFDTDDREQKADYLISGSTVKDFLASCRQKGSEAASVVLSKRRKQINLATTDGITTKRFDANDNRDADKFPDIGKLLGRRVKRQDVTLDLKVLAKMIGVLKSVGAKYVTLGIPPLDEGEKSTTGLVSVVAEAAQGQVTGGVMPVRK